MSRLFGYDRVKKDYSSSTLKTKEAELKLESINRTVGARKQTKMNEVELCSLKPLAGAFFEAAFALFCLSWRYFYQKMASISKLEESRDTSY